MDPTTVYVVVGILAALAIASGWTARDIVGALVSRIRSRGRRFDGSASKPTAASAPPEPAGVARPKPPTTGLLGRQAGGSLLSTPLGVGSDRLLFLSIDPLTVEPGGRVTLRYYEAGHPAGVLSRVECDVLTPDGRLLTSLWPDVPQLTFPDDFAHGSTQLEGRYNVTAFRRSFGEDMKVVSQGSFYVRSGGAK